MHKQKSICFLVGNPPQSKPWDPDIIHEGIAGSEEAVINMSKQLAKMGWDVVVLFIYGGPPEGSLYSHPNSNPQYIRNGALCKTSTFDVAISWRMPTLGTQFKKVAKKLYLWPHDTLGEPIAEEEIEAFDDVLWLSKWQREQWISVSPSFEKFTMIFGNGIEPSHFLPIQERTNPYSCIYGSNYARGLENLLDIWPKVKEEYPQATLDIYYGWEHSGWMNYEPEKEPKMRRQIATLPDIQEHGRVSHEELAIAYGSTGFWTYPCDSSETFCISALKAQFAGAVPVIVSAYALPETVQHGYRANSVEEYYSTLMRAFADAKTITLQDRKKMRDFILQDFTWRKIAAKWTEFFEKTK